MRLKENWTLWEIGRLYTALTRFESQTKEDNRKCMAKQFLSILSLNKQKHFSYRFKPCRKIARKRSIGNNKLTMTMSLVHLQWYTNVVLKYDPFSPSNKYNKSINKINKQTSLRMYTILKAPSLTIIRISIILKLIWGCRISYNRKAREASFTTLNSLLL